SRCNAGLQHWRGETAFGRVSRGSPTNPVDPSPEPGALPASTELLRRWRLFSWLALLVIPGLSPLMDIGAGFCRFSYLKFATPETSWHVTGELSKEGSEGVPQARLDRPHRIRNYIIVMSESLSEKTMGLYGAPFNTTPFMSSIPTKRIEKMVSPSLATAAAVSLFAARPNPQDPLHPHYEDNIITLAKDAGLSTYWVSSQGRMSAYEASISFIADQADVQYFVKKHDDFSLIPVIERIFSAPEPEGRGRLVFVHTYGAHEETCSRVTDVGRPFKTGAEEFLDCYLAAAYKQDLTVEAIARAAERSGESWSIIFTSDHAINFRRDDAGRLIAMRSADYKGQYEVPFVQMGAGVTENEVYRVVRSSMKFRDYFPTWIGVTTNQTPPGYDIFTNRAVGTNVSEDLVLSGLDREEKGKVEGDQEEQEDQGDAGNVEKTENAADAVYVLRGNDEVRPYASLKRTPGMQEVVNGFAGRR
ncbi:sulfatase-like hydrolase/transferase, partial [Sutterella sp.]|uniref:sulfatase-like hydrolase/transferase n=1 Tax=Sutterella sp. TaxID=1981025 RepID=UPI003FD8061C